jgi:outer membrane immunogenic protein
MKKLVLAASILAVSAVSASAADLAARPYTKAPPPMMAAYYDWSGFYIGANGGGAWSHKCFDSEGLAGLPLVTGIRDNCLDASGAVAGGQIGYRWQASSWVFGLEAQGDWANLRGSAVSTLIPFTSARAKIDGLGLFTGQLGYAFNNVLFYVKGGAALADDRYESFTTASGIVTGTASETRWGGTIGAGLEFAFTPNWSLGVEYDHLFLGSRNVTFNVPALGPGLFPVERVGQDVDMVTARINYRFGGPVVARY